MPLTIGNYVRTHNFYVDEKLGDSTTSTKLDLILSKLGDAKPNGNGGHYASCPIHPSELGGSLSISQDVSGEIVFSCQLGCSEKEIRSKLVLVPSRPDHSATSTGLQAASVEAQESLTQEKDLLGRFERDVELAGLVGEKENAKVVLLAAASARLQRPINITVVGESAAGKNHLISTVAQFIPEEHKKFLSGMSPKALMHSDEYEFQHKVILIAEYEGVSGADFAIRTMQSEQVIEWEFVDSSDGGIRKKTNKVRGPAAFIQATTRPLLHPENETRMLFLEMDESPEQTLAILKRQAQEAQADNAGPQRVLFTKWHSLLRSLAQARVVIPFASRLAEQFPASRLRARRDFPKLLGLIETSAYLHQHQRQTDSQGNIIASEQDYLNAKNVFDHCSSTGPDSVVGELLGKLANLGKSEFSIPEVMQATGWKRTKTYKVLSRAEDMGGIEQVDRGRYRLFVRTSAETGGSKPVEIEPGILRGHAENDEKPELTV